MNLCVNCKHHVMLPVRTGTFGHNCGSPNLGAISPVDGERRYHMPGSTYPLCVSQRAEKSLWETLPPRCGYEGAWFEPKDSK